MNTQQKHEKEIKKLWIAVYKKSAHSHKVDVMEANEAIEYFKLKFYNRSEK